jgi:hypothetical protein
LSIDDAEELALVYVALGYDPETIHVSDERGLLDGWPA